MRRLLDDRGQSVIELLIVLTFLIAVALLFGKHL